MKIYVDAARDDDIAAMGWVIILSNGEKITGKRYINDTHTSMEAEYFALLDGLRYAHRESNEEVTVFTDCKPLVKKMRVPDGHSDTWYKRRQGCHRMLGKFEDWELEWTPRASNSKADRLAYEALEEGREAQDL